jgi:hypothetical protein
MTSEFTVSFVEHALAGASRAALRYRLPDVFRALLDDRAHFLVFDVDKDAGYYVQFLPVDGGGLLCEAVSNEFLSDPHRLTPEDELKMVDLGWASPDPNFRQLWEAPVPVHVVAHRIVATLERVYRLQDPSKIAVTIGERKGGPALPPDTDLSDAPQVISFSLDSGICVIDDGALQGWVLEQVKNRRDEFEYVPDYGNVVDRRNPDCIYDLDDTLSTLQLVATLLIGSVPGLEEVSSYIEVD